MKQENHKSLTLGTAMWGWTIPEKTCFELLDHFYASGFRQVDTATNYPINKQPEDFRKAENILLEWINAHGIKDLEVIVKIGSINNLRSPEHNLSKSFILMNLDEYRFKYGANLAMLMIHWDNRDDINEIRQTLEAFESVHAHNLQTGLSGIRHPELYAQLNKTFQFDFHIQIKHNLLQSDYHKYHFFHGKRRFITYGINAGGVKLDPEDYRTDSSLKARGGDVTTEHPITALLRQIMTEANQASDRPPLANMNHFGMIFSHYSPDVASILVGPSTLEQLEDTVEFFDQLQRYDYADVFSSLKKLASDV